MCRIASLFLLQRLKKASQATRTISTISRRELTSSSFSARLYAEEISCHSEKKTLGKQASNYAAVKTGWLSLNVVIFPPV
jgi:hypothetical protein